MIDTGQTARSAILRRKDPLGSLLERPRGSDAPSQEDLVGLSQYMVSMAGSYPASALSFWAMKPSMNAVDGLREYVGEAVDRSDGQPHRRPSSEITRHEIGDWVDGPGDDEQDPHGIELRDATLWELLTFCFLDHVNKRP